MAENVIAAAGSLATVQSYLTPSGGGFSLSSLILGGSLDAVGVFDSLALSPSVSFSRGVLLTSGTGTPARTNTDSGFTTENDLPGDADLTAFASAAFSGAGATEDATVLTLTFVVTDPNIKTLSFNLAFGSDEYPEYSSSNYVDIAAIWTGTGASAVNYGLINGDVAAPLAVIDTNLALGNFIDNREGGLAIEYDGLVARQTVLVPVTLGENVIRIGIADTGDMALDSGLFIFDISGSGSDSGGTFQQVDVTAGGSYDASENDTIFTGSASDFDGVTLTGFDERDQLLFEDVEVGENDAKVTVGSLDLRLDSDGDGLVDTIVTLADPVANATVVFAAGPDGTSISLALLAAATAGADTIDGTDGLDFIAGEGGADTLRGFGGADALSGGAGSDTLLGGAGADWLQGGLGDDVLTGGADGDVFVFGGEAGSTGRDRITDFGFDDVLITTARITDRNGDGTISFGGNRVLDLAGGGRVAITDAAGKSVQALEFDGTVSDGGQTYYVYSLVGSAAGTSFLPAVKESVAM